MRQSRLYEDKLLQKLPIGFSPGIIERINDINWYNRNNSDALVQWHDYLDGLVNYISNPVIAWDNVNRYQHFTNGTTHINELGYDVTFIIKTNKRTKQSYVYVCDANLMPEEYGLAQTPLYESKRKLAYHTERTFRLAESDLYSMVQECVCRILQNQYQ